MTHREPECRSLSNLKSVNTSYAAIIGPTLCPNDIVLKLARVPIVEVSLAALSAIFSMCIRNSARDSTAVFVDLNCIVMSYVLLPQSTLCV